jgi:hypothetical protein
MFISIEGSMVQNIVNLALGKINSILGIPTKCYRYQLLHINTSFTGADRHSVPQGGLVTS